MGFHFIRRPLHSLYLSNIISMGRILPSFRLICGAFLICSLAFTSSHKMPRPVAGMMMDSCDPLDPSFVDSDNDGVGNDCDVDDDNDGILDSDEGCETLFSSEFKGTFGVSPDASPFYRDLETPPGTGYSYGPGTNGNNAAGKYTVTNRQGAILNHPAAIWEYPGHTDGSDTDCFLLVNGSTSVGTFFREDITLTAANGYRYQMWHKGAGTRGPEVPIT